MFEGDFADMCAKKKSAHVDWGTSNTVQRAQMGREDPPRREQKLG